MFIGEKALSLLILSERIDTQFMASFTDYEFIES